MKFNDVFADILKNLFKAFITGIFVAASWAIMLKKDGSLDYPVIYKYGVPIFLTVGVLYMLTLKFMCKK